MGRAFVSLGLSDVGDRSLGELDGDVKDERGDIHGERVRQDVGRKADGVNDRFFAALEYKRRAIRSYYYHLENLRRSRKSL